MKSYRLDEEQVSNIEAIVDTLRAKHQDGGYGSGNWGHLGRPGMRGGSMGGGGMQNRRELQRKGAGYGRYKDIQFTSWSKQRDRVAEPHQMSRKEYDDIPEGSVIVCGEDKFIKKNGAKSLVPIGKKNRVPVSKLCERTDTQIAIPKNSNTNVQSDPERELDARRVRSEKYPKNITDAQADERVRADAGQAYQKMSQDQKDALAAYNGAARAIMNKKMERGTKTGAYAKEIQEAKKAVNSAQLQQDIRMEEALTAKAFMKRFGISQEKLDAAMSANRAGDVLAGSEGYKKGFTTGRIGGPITTGKKVVIHRNVRAGSTGIGVEAFSPTGNGAGPGWDGVSGQSSYSKRNEVILGSGTREVALRSWMDGDTLHVETDVVYQDLK